MLKRIFFKGLIMTLLVLSVFLIASYFVPDMVRDRGMDNTEIINSPLVCFKDSCFSVEIADTPSERKVGLMHRDTLLEDSGMLFIFEEPGTYRFWMKSTLIPLDMIWLDDNLTVIHIVSAEPCIEDPCPYYGPEEGEDSKYVLEIGYGIAEKTGIAVGSQAIFQKSL